MNFGKNILKVFHSRKKIFFFVFSACLVSYFLAIFPFSGFSQTPTPTAPPVEKGISITITVPESPTPTPTPTPTPAPPAAGAPPMVGPTIAVFKGKAYPLAFITLLKNGTVTAAFQAEASGRFQTTLTGLSGGIYTFGIWAEDTEERRSVTLSFTISLLDGTTTTIDGIFISPTISLEPTQVERGDIVDIAGQVFPESQVNLFISSQEFVEVAPADKQGRWGFKLSTSPLEEGEHSARAKALYGEGEQSPFSQTLSFLVVAPGALVCRGADLNFDGKVNIIDFSILLYFWGQRKPANICADINQDGIVNIVDFSIMMYWWSK